MVLLGAARGGHPKKVAALLLSDLFGFFRFFGFFLIYFDSFQVPRLAFFLAVLYTCRHEKF